jgi:hypothetical protein
LVPFYWQADNQQVLLQILGGQASLSNQLQNLYGHVYAPYLLSLLFTLSIFVNILRMSSKIIATLAYTGIIAATLAASLTLLTFTFLNTGVNSILLTLIFFGTLTIYNIDHLRDLNYDESTNPQRVKFIKYNKFLIYFIITLSFMICIVSVFKIDFKIIPILVIPFVLGLLHKRLKSNSIFSAIYITLSWLIVTVFLPAYIANKTSHLLWISLVIGILLLCNAYTSSLDQKISLTKHIRFIVVLSLVPLIMILILKSKYIGLIPLSIFTTISLLNYNDNENYEQFYLDGLQLAGTVISILILNFFIC